jgi:hypothetical protein
MTYITDSINPESFYQEFSESEDYGAFDQAQQVEIETIPFTEEDMQEVDISNCPICKNDSGNHKIRICEECQNKLNN